MRREVWPESVTALIPKGVDQCFFSIDDNGNTQAKVSDGFSTVEVTISKREEVAVQVAAAAIGIYSEKLGARATEHSLEMTPDFIKEMEATIKKSLGGYRKGCGVA